MATKSVNTIPLLSESLKTQRDAMAVHSGNVQNAKTDGYISAKPQYKASIIGGFQHSPKIDEILLKFDKYKAKELCSATSSMSSDKAIAENVVGIAQNIVYFGNIAETIDQYLANIEGGKANNINDIESVIEQLNRVKINIDEQSHILSENISSSVKGANSSLRLLYRLSMQRLTANDPSEKVRVATDIHNELLNLSSYMDVDHYYDSKGMLNVRTKYGRCQLLGESVKELEHKQKVKGDGATISTIHLKDPANQYDVSVDITEDIYGGLLKGQIEAKDSVLPEILSQIDGVACHVSEFINSISNVSTPRSGYSRMQSSRKMSLNSEVNVSGDFVIGMLGKGGVPSTIIKTDEISSSGLGNITVKKLLKEIEETSNKSTRANIDGIYDIQLAPMQKSQPISGIDMEFDITSCFPSDDVKDNKFQLQGLELLQNGVTQSLDVSSAQTINVKNGDRSRSGTSSMFHIPESMLTYDSDGNLTQDITVTVSAKVITGDLGEREVKLTFELPKSKSDLSLSKTSATNLEEVSGGSFEGASAAILEDMGDKIKAYLVDEDGIPIDDDNKQGFLVLESANSEVNFAIKELNSNMSGVLSGAARLNKGFCNFFGMNELLIQKNAKKSGLPIKAGEMLINPNLPDDGVLKSPRLVSIDKSQALGLESYFFVKTSKMGSDDIKAIKDKQSFTSSSAEDLTGYVKEKHNDTMSILNTIEEKTAYSSNRYEAIQEAFDEVSGVDITREIEMISELQMLYSSITELSKVFRSLTDTLLRSVSS